ncbi:hypothetical protein GCM10020000_44740 [Streptomyces olivoverticillatus]
MLAMFGSFRPADGLSRPAYLTFMALAGLGTLLTAAYMLVVVRRVCMGGNGTETAGHKPGTPPVGPLLADVQSYELVSWTPLVALTVLAGLWPAALIGLTDPAVQQLLRGGK